MNPMDCYPSFNRNVKEVAAARDAELVAAAQSGSSAAFAELQHLYARPLYSTILRITRNREDAEDALQDTFLRMFVSLRSFEGRSSFYSWLTRIGINSALMLLRKRRARAEISFELPTDSLDENPTYEIRDSAPNPEQICDQRQRCDNVLHAIQKLDPHLRTAIQIQVKHGSPLKEIARTLEISEAAVKARLYRARVRLSRKVLRNHGGQRRTPPLPDQKSSVAFAIEARPA